MKRTPITIKLLALVSLTLMLSAALSSLRPAALLSAASAAESISLVLPQDNTLVEDGMLNIVVAIQNSALLDTVTATSNGLTVATVSINREKKYACRGISLERGPNEIVVSALKDGKVVETLTTTVFYRSELSKEFRTAPAVFQPRRFHVPESESPCAPCHSMTVAEKDYKPASPADSACYSCHKKMAENRFVHGPIAKWYCLFCHDPGTQPAKYRTKEVAEHICFTCHKEEKEDWTAKRYFHGPTGKGKCTICHTTHTSENPFQLRLPTTELCLRCHPEVAKAPHAVGSFSQAGHPYASRKEARSASGVLTCASCHNPHSSDTEYLFKYPIKKPFDLCKNCHTYDKK